MAQENFSITSPPLPSSPSPGKPRWLVLFRSAVALSVVLAIGYTGFQTARQLQHSPFDFRQIDVTWWGVAVAVYIMTMGLAWSFWHRVLVALGQVAPPGKTLLAFFASQLGKYVPGKAMVVVIRTDLVRGERVQTGPAAASVFIETLTWLFVGSAIGCFLVMLLYRDQPVLLMTAAVLMVVTGALTSPPLFRRIAQRVAIARGENADTMLGGLGISTLAFGWFVMTIGWCLNGLSLWLVLYGLGADIGIGDYPLTLACVCLATAAGFVSLLPGGIGVRELVMIPLLGARFGSVTAVVAAIVIRVVWLSAELLTSAIIYGVMRWRKRKESGPNR